MSSFLLGLSCCWCFGEKTSFNAFGVGFHTDRLMVPVNAPGLHPPLHHHISPPLFATTVCPKAPKFSLDAMSGTGSALVVGVLDQVNERVTSVQSKRCTSESIFPFGCLQDSQNSGLTESVGAKQIPGDHRCVFLWTVRTPPPSDQVYQNPRNPNKAAEQISKILETQRIGRKIRQNPETQQFSRTIR